MWRIGQAMVLLEKPSRLELNALWVALGCLGIVASEPVIPFVWVKPVLYCSVAICLVVFIRLAAFCVLLINRRTLRKWHEWVELSTVALLVALVLLGHASVYIRLCASAHQLQEKSLRMLDGPQDADSWKNHFSHTGLYSYRVYRVDDESRIVWYETGNGSALFWAQGVFGGIVYSESGEPTEPAESHYRHLWGPWWQWAQDM